MLALAAQHGMEDFYAEKYLDTLRVGAETEPDELFDKSHGFYIAVIQGFFRDYYYTRGSSFSLLMEESPEYVRYFTPWAQVVPTAFPNPAENQIIENYCSGVYLSRDQVTQLPPGSGAGTKGDGRSGGSLERWAACGAEKGTCNLRQNWVSVCWKPLRWWNLILSAPMRVRVIPTCTTATGTGCIST